MVRFLSGPDRLPEPLLPDRLPEQHFQEPELLLPDREVEQFLPDFSSLTLAEEDEEGDLSLLPVFLVPAPQTSGGWPVSPCQLPSLLATLARENMRSDSSLLNPSFHRGPPAGFWRVSDRATGCFLGWGRARPW